MSVNVKQNGNLTKVANNISIVQANWNDRGNTNKNTCIKNQPATLKTLEEIEANTNENALVGANAVKQLSESLAKNIRYNPDTDMIQILFNNTWIDWGRAGMNYTYIYNIGNEVMALDLSGYSLSAYTKYNKWVKNSNCLSCEAPPVNYYSIIGTNGALDISSFTKLHVLYESNIGSKEAIIDLIGLTSTNCYISICYLCAVANSPMLMILLSTTKVANADGTELKRYTDSLSGTIKVHKIWLS